METSKFEKFIREGFALSTLVTKAGNLFGGMLVMLCLLYSLFISCGIFFGVQLSVMLTSTQIYPAKARDIINWRGNVNPPTL